MVAVPWVRFGGGSHDLPQKKLSIFLLLFWTFQTISNFFLVKRVFCPPPLCFLTNDPDHWLDLDQTKNFFLVSRPTPRQSESRDQPPIFIWSRSGQGQVDTRTMLSLHYCHVRWWLFPGFASAGGWMTYHKKSFKYLLPFWTFQAISKFFLVKKSPPLLLFD